MNIDLLDALVRCETDIDGAMQRFAGNETLYVACLDGFLQDTTMAELNAAIESQSWDDAFTAAHALKGLAGNMGFVPLFHATGELVVNIRAGRLTQIEASNRRVGACYNDIITAICLGSGVRKPLTKGV